MTPKAKLRFIFFFIATPYASALCEQVVINAGAPGQNTAEIAERAVPLLQATHPDIVVLFAGMNDAVNEKKFLTPEGTREEVLRIVRLDTDAGAVTVIVTVHAPDEVRLLARHDPRVYADRSPSQRVDAVNSVLQQIAQEQHLAVADFHTILQQAGGANTTLSTDGVHLTASGYRLLASTVRLALRGNLQGKTILCLGDSITYGIGVRAADSPEGADTYPAQLRQMLQSALEEHLHNR